MQRTRKRVEVNLEEPDQIIDRGMRTPLNESEGQKLKTALHAMAERLSWKRSTGALAPRRLPAQTEFRSRTSRSTPATGARSAAREKSTVRRNRRHGCGS